MAATQAVDRAVPAAALVTVPRGGRNVAVDVLRGLTIVGMVLVNNPGSSKGWPQLSHAAWNGSTVADFVFPGFLFVVGLSITLSQRTPRPDASAQVARIVRRAVLLVALGLLLNWLDPLTSGALRYPGVLQRIGLAYLIAALAVAFLPLTGQLALGGVLFAGYWFALLHINVPGHGAGVLTPAGNLAGWVDRTVFGQAHLYRHATYDPEGLLSTAGAVVTVLIGAWAAAWMRRRPRDVASVVGLAAGGILLAAAGWGWRGSLPFNKRIWSPSFTLWTAGWFVLALAVLWLVFEVIGWRWLRHPWVALGSNALLLYVMTELGDRILGLVHLGHQTVHEWTFTNWFAPHLGPAAASAAWSFAFVGVWGVFVALLYRRHLFLRL